MSSTYTHPEHLDRKALKKPDEFLTAVSRFFGNLAKNTRGVTIVAGVLLLLVLAGALLTSRQSNRSAEARNAFFLAEKTFEKELKTLAAASAPKTAGTTQKTPADQAAAKEKEEAAHIEAVLYQKLDVDARFPESVAQLKSVSEKFSGTRSAHEAQLLLGRLYYDHGDTEKALPWLIRALGSAPSQKEKVLAGLAVGHAHEDLGKYPEAVQDYESAAKLAEGNLKGDVFLSLARTFELMKDSVKARAVYDQIISTMGGTEYAKTAELRKSQVE